MAAQTLPLGYCGEDETSPARPLRPHSRTDQPSQELSYTVLIARRPHLAPANWQSISLLSPEANVATALVRISAAIVAEIDALLAGHQDETTPTEYAYGRARAFVESAYGRIKLRESVPEIIPSVSVTTDDLGGIRLAWRSGPKQMRANFGDGGNRRSYIYFESGMLHGVEDLDVQHLAGRLAWLTER